MTGPAEHVIRLPERTSVERVGCCCFGRCCCSDDIVQLNLWQRPQYLSMFQTRRLDTRRRWPEALEQRCQAGDGELIESVT
jgi:hypothetical protein